LGLFCRIAWSGFGSLFCNGACGESGVEAFGREAAKCLKRAMENALRGGASAVNGHLTAPGSEDASWKSSKHYWSK
jgi:hypothetical protein